MGLQEILDRIDGSRDDIIRDMIGMIRIPAIGPSNGGEGESKRADLLMTYLKGFDTVERIDVEDFEYPGVIRPSILARKKGKKDGTVWMIAHMDTVLPGDLEDWECPPFEPHFENGRIYGLGTEDNGQAVLSSIYAARFFEDEELNGHSIGVALVPDEETTNRMGVDYLIKKGYFSKDDIIIVPDWGSPGSKMVDVAEKHLLWVKVSVTGKQTHGSTPQKGINAYRVSTMFLADLLTRLNERYGDEDLLFRPPVSTFEPTKSSSTVGNINTIPGYDELWMDCRIIPKYDPNEIVNFIKDVAKEHSEKSGAAIEIEVSQLTLSGKISSTDTAEFKTFADSIASVTGIVPVASGIGGGTCANFFRHAGINSYAWESEGGSLHQPNEFVKVDNIITDAKVFATFFHRMCVIGN